MTDNDKLKKLKKLADAMYYAAKYLTTDASMLHKAMDEYHKFIIYEYKEEPVSEPQVKESAKIQHVKETCKENDDSLTQEPVRKIIFDGNFNKSWYAHPELAFKAGMKEMREQMMKGAYEREIKVDAGGYPYIPQMELYDYDKDIPLAKEGDKVKILVIRKV